MKNGEALNDTTLSDHELVSMTQAGNLEAYAELIRRHQGACFKVALTILRDVSDAEDEVQNALWKGFEHIDQFQQQAMFTTWLTRIVVNQCLMRLRQMRRARFLYIDEVSERKEVAAIELQDKGSSPEQQVSREELTTLLNREVHRIPPLLRSVLLLRDVERLPMLDVANKLGISVAAAKSRLLRARSELRERMAAHMEGVRHGTVMT